MYFVGIDWADKFHQVCILDAKRKMVLEFAITHSYSGFSTLMRELEKLTKDRSQIGLICETKHNLLISFLLKEGYTVYCVNPKAINRFRDTKRASTAKSDSFDAFCLADFLASNKEMLKPLPHDDEKVKKADSLYRFRSRLVRQKVSIQNSLKSHLKSYYPRSLELFGLDTKIFASFLKKYPTPESLGRETKEGFVNFLKEMRYTQSVRINKLAEIIKQEQIKVDKTVAESASTFTLMILAQLELVTFQIANIEQQIEEFISSFEPARLITSIPGAGAVVAAGIIAGLGEPGRYSSASAVQCLAGTAPVTRQSGNYKYVRMRKSCNKHLRNASQHLAFSSISYCKWAKEFYNMQRKKGKSHHGALRTLANKWFRIIFAMLKNNTPYNESCYLANKQRFCTA